MSRKLRILQLYPDLMNLYGDRGNVLALRARCRWHGIEPVVETAGLGEAVDLAAHDIVVIGGGQDKEQRLVCRELAGDRGRQLATAVEDGLCVLAICGAYQLLGKYYVTPEGEHLPGAGIFNVVTESATDRLVGHIVVDVGGRTLVGFENHGGRTTLGPEAVPLGRVRWGFGNNGRDGTEGAVHRHAYGTYLHGPLLPGNPWFADHLLALALERRYGQSGLGCLEDALDTAAHRVVIRESRVDASRRLKEKFRTRGQEPEATAGKR